MIGVYDSGFGGLTVLKALQKQLPERDFCYLGDTGRAPYGGREAGLILDLAEQCIERLFDEGCRLVVVACHTVSCVGLRHLQQRYARNTSDRRILGVTIPAAEAAARTSTGHIGWIGTTRTIASRTWETELHKINPTLTATGIAAPLLAPLVEEGDFTQDPELSALARIAIRRYLGRLPAGADTLVLGCTHYPLLKVFFEEEAPHLHILDPGPEVATRLQDWLARHPGFDESGEGRLMVLCTGDPFGFQALGSRFLGKELPSVGHLHEQGGRLISRERPLLEVGQLVRL